MYVSTELQYRHFTRKFYEDCFAMTQLEVAWVRIDAGCMPSYTLMTGPVGCKERYACSLHQVQAMPIIWTPGHQSWIFPALLHGQEAQRM